MVLAANADPEPITVGCFGEVQPVTIEPVRGEYSERLAASMPGRHGPHVVVPVCLVHRLVVKATGTVRE